MSEPRIDHARATIDALRARYGKSKTKRHAVRQAGSSRGVEQRRSVLHPEGRRAGAGARRGERVRIGWNIRAAAAAVLGLTHAGQP